MCLFDCGVEGDCDPGYHCVDQSCLPACDDDSSCTFPTVCRQPDIARDVEVCVASYGTRCVSDADCRGVCNYGVCTIECENPKECGSGVCELGELERNVCYVLLY